MASGGFTFTQGIDPQAQVAQAAQQQQTATTTASAILNASTLMEQKRRQAYLKYENARQYMRNDLNQIAQFDVSSAGTGQMSDALSQLADDAREQIKEANNTIEAQEIIANFKEQYDMLVARETSISEKRQLFENASHATGADIDALNAGLDADQQYVIPEVSDVANSENKWHNPFEGGIQVVDGRLMAVDPTDNVLKEITDIEAFLNDSMFDLQTEQITVGSISDWAMTQTVVDKIKLKDGSWNRSRAESLYNDAIMQVGRTGDRTSSGAVHRREVLNTLETRELISPFDEDERKAFINGNFDYFNTESSKETLDEVIEKGREIFVKESKFGFDSPEDIKTKEDAALKTQQESLEGYSMRGLTATSQGQTFDLYSIPETIDVEGSVHVEGGEYSIYGFNVNPTDGSIVARIKKEEKVLMYEYVDENNVVQLANTLEQAQRLGQPTGETEEFTKGGTPETITIEQDGKGLSREVFNKLFAEDPIALSLLGQELDAYNTRILDEALEQQYQETPANVDPDAPIYTTQEDDLLQVGDIWNRLTGETKTILGRLDIGQDELEQLIRAENITTEEQLLEMINQTLSGRSGAGASF
tara:strand:+ start:1455 stop:3227 length:1773 start_codon:yes stop_codon:yes gene_type:complete